MEFLSVTTTDEALSKLASHGNAAAVLAGGTAVLYQLKSGMVSADIVLHVERLAELSYVQANGCTTFGALTSLRKIATAPELNDKYGAIRTAAASCGGWQTQSVATIGGNVCNASPGADLVPPLLVHGAKLTLASEARDERSLPLEEFLVGGRRTAREPDELLTAITLDTPPPRTADTYVKIRRRGAMELPIIGLALRLTMDAAGKSIDGIRIAVCAAGPVPFRATAAEDILTGEAANGDALKEAGASLLDRAELFTDARASAEYRRAVLPRALAHAVKDCAARAGSGAH